MKATRRMDGSMCANVTVSVPLSLSDMADLYTARHDFDAPRIARESSKAKIMEDIRDYITTDGTERAGYVVGDGNLNDYRTTVEEIFTNRFAREFAE